MMAEKVTAVDPAGPVGIATSISSLPVARIAVHVENQPAKCGISRIAGQIRREEDSTLTTMCRTVLTERLHQRGRP